MHASKLSRLIDTLREVADVATALWWRFFDWVAVVEWRRLYMIWFIALMTAAMVDMPQPAVFFIMISAAVKVLAGGKRRAELMAQEATKKADVATLERRLAEAQMAALQAQVEPHFLFNTLALIGQLIETDPPEAARVHQHLIDYLRSTLPQLRAKGGATLGRQVDMSRAYLAIMQARMKERLSVSVELPAELKEAPFPPMMLQSLIENAIKHGLEPKIAGGHIAIRAARDGDMLEVAVSDDGVGFDLHADDGVGLSNIRERLQLLFGERAQLVVEAPAQGGARCAIRVPYNLRPAWES